MTRKLPSFFLCYEINNRKHKLKNQITTIINERREKRVPNRFSGSEIGLYYSPGYGNLT